MLSKNIGVHHRVPPRHAAEARKGLIASLWFREEGLGKTLVRTRKSRGISLEQQGPCRVVSRVRDEPLIATHIETSSAQDARTVRYPAQQNRKPYMRPAGP